MMKKITTCILFLFVITALQAQVDPTIFDKFESKFLTIDGYKINVEVKGTGDPIFFIPGGPGNSHDYMQGALANIPKPIRWCFLIFWAGENRMTQKTKANIRLKMIPT
ncbi:MAG: hypothetical protein Q7U59_00375 [Lutibacter sp.]|nr:hypothetical protein [Lutibacter sp.]